jgi:hypothetical protein
MAKRQKSAAVVGLFVYTTEKEGYFHANAYPVTIGHTADELAHIDAGDSDYARKDVNSDTIRNCNGDYSRTQNGLRLDGLSAHSQGNCSDETRQLYGWEVSYRDVYKVGLSDAKGMYQTLTTVEKRMAAISEQFGRPLSYGQYLLHFARAIGATRFVFRQDNRPYASSYADQDIRITELATGADSVDYLVKKWIAGEPVKQS